MDGSILGTVRAAAAPDWRLPRVGEDPLLPKLKGDRRVLRVVVGLSLWRKGDVRGEGRGGRAPVRAVR